MLPVNIPASLNIPFTTADAIIAIDRTNSSDPHDLSCLVKLTTHRLATSVAWTCNQTCGQQIWCKKHRKDRSITSRVKSLDSSAENLPCYIFAPVCETNVLTAADSCPLVAPPWEPVCPATPGRRRIATILIALLSPSIVAAQCVKLTVSLSARFHTVARGTAERSIATVTYAHRATASHTAACKHTSVTLLTNWSADTFKI